MRERKIKTNFTLLNVYFVYFYVLFSNHNSQMLIKIYLFIKIKYKPIAIQLLLSLNLTKQFPLILSSTTSELLF